MSIGRRFKEWSAVGPDPRGPPFLVLPAPWLCFRDWELAYDCHGGVIRNKLLAVSVQLCDTDPEDGGFVALPGSHKANFAAPKSVLRGETHAELLQQPRMRKGQEMRIAGSLVWEGAWVWNPSPVAATGGGVWEGPGGGCSCRSKLRGRLEQGLP